jgi:hypothetical protein
MFSITGLMQPQTTVFASDSEAIQEQNRKIWIASSLRSSQ